jgi:hypothetical protein
VRRMHRLQRRDVHVGAVERSVAVRVADQVTSSARSINTDAGPS